MNRLTYIEDDKKKHWNQYCFYKCNCWTIKSINKNHVKKWYTKSCWCLHREKFNNYSHWLTKTRIHTIWTWMKQRCKVDNNYYWKWITISNDWNKFINFYNDMKESYQEHLTLDRIKNNLWYSKKNCRWATQKEQQRNRTNNIVYKWKCIAEWRELLWISKWKFDRLRYVKKISLEEIFWI